MTEQQDPTLDQWDLDKEKRDAEQAEVGENAAARRRRILVRLPRVATQGQRRQDQRRRQDQHQRQQSPQDQVTAAAERLPGASQRCQDFRRLPPLEEVVEEGMIVRGRHNVKRVTSEKVIAIRRDQQRLDGLIVRRLRQPVEAIDLVRRARLAPRRDRSVAQR